VSVRAMPSIISGFGDLGRCEKTSADLLERFALVLADSRWFSTFRVTAVSRSEPAKAPDADAHNGQSVWQ